LQHQGTAGGVANYIHWIIEVFAESIRQACCEVCECRRQWQARRATGEVHLETGLDKRPSNRQRQPATESSRVGMLGGETNQIYEWPSCAHAQVGFAARELTFNDCCH
jgi:hypothetical protein